MHITTYIYAPRQLASSMPVIHMCQCKTITQSTLWRW